MEVNAKVVIYSLVIALILLLVLASLGIVSFNFGKTSPSLVSSSNMPDKCKVPAGQDVSAWKEHLGHHAETRDCLKYFE